MFKKLLNKVKSSQESNNENKELIDYISSADLNDMRSLLLGKVNKFPVSEESIIHVLKKMISQSDKTKKRFLEASDDDSKLKKAFELVIVAAQNKKISVEAVELIGEFIALYKDLIEAYDTKNKQIYMYKLSKAMESSIMMVELIVANINKMQMLN